MSNLQIALLSAVVLIVLVFLVVHVLRNSGRAQPSGKVGEAEALSQSDAASEATKSPSERPSRPPPGDSYPSISNDGREDDETLIVRIAHTRYEKGVEQTESKSETPLFSVHIVAKSDRGQKRSRNEDSVLVLPERNIAVVCDGMGGHAGGEIASREAVKIIRESFEKKIPDGTTDSMRSAQANEFVWAIEAANEHVFNLARSNSEIADMGTTCIGLRFAPLVQRAYLAFVGDSRCYRLRNQTLAQISRDHTLAAEGVAGIFANNLTRSVGTHRKVMVDMFVDKPAINDVYVLCSDGLTKMLTDADIQAILCKKEPLESRLDELIGEANQRGGDDNISVILAHIKDANV